MGVGGQHHTLAALPPVKTRYPLYRRLGGPQERAGRVQIYRPPPGFDPRSVRPVASRYTDWAIAALPAANNRHHNWLPSAVFSLLFCRMYSLIVIQWTNVHLTVGELWFVIWTRFFWGSPSQNFSCCWNFLLVVIHFIFKLHFANDLTHSIENRYFSVLLRYNMA